MIEHEALPLVRLEREADYRFRVRFTGPGAHELIADELPPLGNGDGPNPMALLAAAIAQCLASSLVFCLTKAHLDVRGLAAETWVETTRNEQGRLRIRGVRVRLAPYVTAEVRERMSRCLELFESFCTVTESVRHGIDVRVEVEPGVTGAVTVLPKARGCGCGECGCQEPNGIREPQEPSA